jgi:hypothetical protein
MSACGRVGCGIWIRIRWRRRGRNSWWVFNLWWERSLWWWDALW